MRSAAQRPHHDDRGSILPLTLIFIGAISLTVLALSSYVVSNLRHGAVTELRSDRLSAADAGMRYAIDQLKLRNAGCILDTQEAVLPGVEADFNGATASVVCERITSGFEGIQAYAAVLTGEGLSPTQSLLSSQSGSNSKILGGPVYMSRVDPSAFSLGPPVQIENGPLLYHDPSGSERCTSVKASTLPSTLVFEPELIFGPVCVSVPWEELFASPAVPNLTGLTPRNGAVSRTTDPVAGSYTQVTSGGGCRVFEPGRYTTPPDTRGTDAYFKTGDYVMDFTGPWVVRQSVVSAGRMNAQTTTTREIATTNACLAAQAADTAPVGETGATFYFARGSSLNIATQGSIEINARRQGSNYVSVQTLCAPNGDWCRPGGDGGLGAAAASTLRAPAATSTANLIYTDSGNQKEFVAHALVYAPLAQVEFGNVTNTATQRMKGGLIVSRLVLQSSTSATNFEISVPTSPITAEILLTSTAVRDGFTSVQAVVQYRPYETSIDDRVRVNSWRVCARASCEEAAGPPPPPVCTGSDPTWQASYFANANLGGSVVHSGTPTAVDLNWGSGSPAAPVPVHGFSARFTRTVDFPAAGMYRFTIGRDDGQRLFVNGLQVFEDWETQSYAAGTNTVDVLIDDPCSVDLKLEYYENTGVARVSLNWVAL